MSHLANKLKEIRKEKGYSQQSLSDELNIKRSAYGNYETGMSYPEFSILKKISDFYKVDMRYFLEDSENLEKKLNSAEEAGNMYSSIEEYYYKRYRVIPTRDFIKKSLEK